MAVPTPVVVESPKVVPTKTLKWSRESLEAGIMSPIPQRPPSYPDLSGLNVLEDGHGQIRNFDLLVTTAGNFNVFLNFIMTQRILQMFPNIANGSWYYTTSPPIAGQQIPNARMTFGNVQFNGVPSVAMGPNGHLNGLISNGFNEGSAVSLLSNWGNVLMVKKGNPKNIQSVWDLKRSSVKVGTSNPIEAGSFGNYSSSIHNIAFWDVYNQTGDVDDALEAADDLFDTVFNKKDNATSNNPKWFVGERIMHRHSPQLLADDVVDVVPLFYHLAQTAINRTELGSQLFEIVPLGGTVANPNPLVGNRVGTMRALKINQATGGFSAAQLQNRDDFFDTITDVAGNAAYFAPAWVREPVTTGNNQPDLP